MAVYEENMFDIGIGLKTYGADDLLIFFTKVEAALKRLGLGSERVQELMESVFSRTLGSAHLQEEIQAIANAYDKFAKNRDALEAERKKREAFRESQRQFMMMARTIRQPFGEISRTLILGGVAIGHFYAALKPGQKLLGFAEGIAKVNMQLRSLANNSTMTVRELVGAGGALSVFGGNAGTAAARNKKYETTLANIMRGGGLGYLQESAWKYGFQFDLNESSEQRFQRAIRHYQGLSRRDRMAFAQSEGWSQADIDAANMGPAWYAARKARMSKYGEFSEEAGSKATELRTSLEEFNGSIQKIKDQIFIALVPIIVNVTKTITTVTTALGKWSKTISLLTKGFAILAGMLTGVKVIGGLIALTTWALAAARSLAQVAAAGAASSVFGRRGAKGGLLKRGLGNVLGSVGLGKGGLISSIVTGGARFGAAGLSWLGGLAGAGAGAGAAALAVGALGVAVGNYAAKAIIGVMEPGEKEMLRKARKDMDEAKQFMNDVKQKTREKIKANGISQKTQEAVERLERIRAKQKKQTQLEDKIRSMHGNVDVLSDNITFRTKPQALKNDYVSHYMQTINNYGPVTQETVDQIKDNTKTAFENYAQMQKNGQNGG